MWAQSNCSGQTETVVTWDRSYGRGKMTVVKAVGKLKKSQTDQRRYCTARLKNRIGLIDSNVNKP